MGLVALVILAQEGSPIDPSIYERLGTAGAVALVLGAWIWWLIKDRARVITQRDAMFAQLVDAEQRSSTLVATIGPTLEANTRALNHAGESAR